MLGASAALAVSDIPWDGPIAGVRVGCLDGQYVINPTQEQLDHSSMNITIAGSATAILMVEGGAQQVPEEQVLDAIMFGHEAIRKNCGISKIRSSKKWESRKWQMEKHETPADIESAIREYAEGPMKRKPFSTLTKLTREVHMAEVRKRSRRSISKEIYPDHAS